ncbi:MAG TPA: FAD-dependent cmnm(5)s(2)U34 oxidoreductase, partial [Acinetobacter radioresistens]|nr:FAD-dependent cmnm(5)s(2)U34 oxidoreductase [Acinetobacter radioresistens]
HSTTFTSFSVAGVLKRGLRSHDIQVTRPRSFGQRREMLKAIWQPSVANAATEKQEKPESLSSGQLLPRIAVKTTHRQKQIAVIGAG